MSTAIVILFTAGLIFLGFEVIVPGAILGIFACICLMAGVGLSFAEYGRDGGLLALAGSLFAVAALVYFEFRILPRTRIGRRMFLEKAVDGTSQAPVAEKAAAVVGREAVALTALGPTGLVQVGGRSYEARCDSGFAVEGARLRVVRVETFQLVVIADELV